jgi:hypothetical protein
MSLQGTTVWQSIFPGYFVPLGNYLLCVSRAQVAKLIYREVSHNRTNWAFVCFTVMWETDLCVGAIPHMMDAVEM